MRGSDGRARPSRLLTSSSDNRSGDFWPAEAKPFASEWLLPSTTNRSPGPSPGQARSSSRRLLPRTRQDAVDAFPRLRHRLFLARVQASQRGPRQDGKVGARGVDADAPLRPLTPGDDVVAAIAASLRGRHLRGSFPPPVSSHNAPTAGWFQRCLDIGLTLSPSPLAGEGFLPRACALLRATASLLERSARKSHGGKGEG